MKYKNILSVMFGLVTFVLIGGHYPLRPSQCCEGFEWGGVEFVRDESVPTNVTKTVAHMAALGTMWAPNYFGHKTHSESHRLVCGKIQNGCRLVPYPILTWRDHNHGWTERQ